MSDQPQPTPALEPADPIAEMQSQEAAALALARDADAAGDNAPASDAFAQSMADATAEIAALIGKSPPSVVAPSEPHSTLPPDLTILALGAAADIRAPRIAPAAPAPAAAPGVFARISASLAPLLAWRPSGAPRRAAYAAGAATALVAGWLGASLLPASSPKPDPAVAAAAQSLARMDRLSEDIRAVRESVAALSKAPRGRSADDLKPLQERITALANNFERVEKLDREIATRLQQVAERLDRIERQTSAPQITGSVTPKEQPAPVAPAPTTPAPQQIPPPPPRPEAAAADEKPAATSIEKKTVAGWALRDMYDGVALIESRRAGLMEVAPGQVVRGLGRIEKFERRGRQWVVVTEQGVITSN